jgi:Ethanolamine utilization protein EutJ (predicted chaperonin)
MKKRYSLTLTVENFENFQRIAKQMNFGQDALSRFVDKFLEDSINSVNSALFEKLQSRNEPIALKDLINLANGYVVKAGETETEISFINSKTDVTP